MTRQEAVAKAKETIKAVGVVVWAAFIDDWLENVGFLAAGIGVGWLIGRFL